MPDLYEVASAFRGAIEEAVRNGELKELNHGKYQIPNATAFDVALFNW